jgi:hypothetical protein
MAVVNDTLIVLLVMAVVNDTLIVLLVMAVVNDITFTCNALLE